MDPQVSIPLQHQPSPPAEIKPRKKYKLLLYGLGIAEVIGGVLSCALCAATMVVASQHPMYKSGRSNGVSHWHFYYYELTFSGQGIWCGLVIFAMGIVGIQTKKHPSVGMYKGNMAFSIFTAHIAVVLIIMSSAAAATTNYRRGDLRGIHVTLAVIGFMEMIICIVHAAFCCASICCREHSFRGSVMYVPQQMVHLANGQFVTVPYQPVFLHGNAVPMVGSPTTLLPHGTTTLPPQNAPFYSFAPVLHTEKEDVQSDPPSYTAVPSYQGPSS